MSASGTASASAAATCPPRSAARSTRQALALLDADPDTELIVLVGKPPAAEVEAALADAPPGCGTPVLFALLGPGRPDLTAAGRAGRWRPLGAGVAASRAAWPGAGATATRRGAPVCAALFSGGTLCDEAMVAGAAERSGRSRSNIPLRRSGSRVRRGRRRDAGHAMIDFGDDALTRRPAAPDDRPLAAARAARRAEAADPP